MATIDNIDVYIATIVKHLDIKDYKDNDKFFFGGWAVASVVHGQLGLTAAGRSDSVATGTPRLPVASDCRYNDPPVSPKPARKI